MVAGLGQNQALVRKINAVFLMNFEHDGKVVQQYTFDFKSKDAGIRKGDEGRANVTLNVEDADFLKICMGELDTAKAFMTRRMRASGNLALLQRLQTVLKTIQTNNIKEKSKL
ncbi:unnamed protein product, partial [Mesorhabditis spiculigera]